MPLHDYKCECGEKFEHFAKIADLGNPVMCRCGKVAARQLCFSVVSVMPSYQSPVTGKWIDTPRQRRYDLDSSGSREWEGREQETKYAQQREKDFDKILDKSAEKAAVESWQALPQETRRKLESSG